MADPPRLRQFFEKTIFPTYLDARFSIAKRLSKQPADTSPEAEFMNRNYNQCVDAFLQDPACQKRMSAFSCACVAAVLSSRDLGVLQQMLPPSIRLIAGHAAAGPVTRPQSNISEIPKKYRIIEEVATSTGIPRMVESGTFTGTSPLLLRDSFISIQTIEADPLLARATTQMFCELGVSNTSVTCGDSSDLLGKLVAVHEEPLLLFLDAHWSYGATSRRYGVSPLLRELATLPTKSHCDAIVIDDVRTLNGTRGNPDLSTVVELLTHTHAISIESDVLIATR